MSEVPPLTAESFDVQVNAVIDEAIRRFAHARSELAAQIEHLCELADKSPIPDHLAMATVVAAFQRFEKAIAQ